MSTRAEPHHVSRGERPGASVCSGSTRSVKECDDLWRRPPDMIGGIVSSRASGRSKSAALRAECSVLPTSQSEHAFVPRPSLLYYRLSYCLRECLSRRFYM